MGIGCAFVALIFGLFVCAFRPVVRWFYLHDKPADVQLAAQKFMTEPQNFPVAWTVSPKVHNETNSKTGEFVRKWQTIAGPLCALQEQLRAGTSLQDALSTHVAIAALAGPVVTFTSETVHRSGFVLTLPSSGLAYQSIARATGSIAVDEAHKGDYAEALEAAMLPLYMSRRPVASNLLVHLIDVALQSLATPYVVTVAADCPDGALLKRALDELDVLRPQIVLNVLSRGELLEVLGELQQFKARGLAVSLQPGKPLVFYYQQIWKYKRQVLEEEIGQEPLGSPLREQLEHELLLFNWQFRWQSSIIPEIAYLMNQPNFTEAVTREQVATARIDLVRLFIAQRIEALTGATGGTTSPQEIVKKHFTNEPRDPFTGIDYKFDGREQSFYSVGPDKADDGNWIEYDTTNGTLSQGDLPVPRLR